MSFCFFSSSPFDHPHFRVDCVKLGPVHRELKYFTANTLLSVLFFNRVTRRSIAIINSYHSCIVRVTAAGPSSGVDAPHISAPCDMDASRNRGNPCKVYYGVTVEFPFETPMVPQDQVLVRVVCTVVGVPVLLSGLFRFNIFFRFVPELFCVCCATLC